MFDTYIYCLLFVVGLSLIHGTIAWFCFFCYEEVIKIQWRVFRWFFLIFVAGLWCLTALFIWLTPWWIWVPVLVILEIYSIIKMAKYDRDGLPY